MNLGIQLTIVLLVAHFIGDFIMQSDAWARGKSSSNVALTKHVATYMAVLCAAMVHQWPGNFTAVIAFAATNGISHWGIDWVTSRINKRLWAQGRVHDFFVCVGADQMLHYATLFGTAVYFHP